MYSLPQSYNQTSKCKRCISSNAYKQLPRERFVIFPYKIENEKAILYSECELQSLFPKGYAYLKECEQILRGREKGRFDIDEIWFQFGRQQGIVYGAIPKLLSPEISMGGNFVYDINGEFYVSI